MNHKNDKKGYNYYINGHNLNLDIGQNNFFKSNNNT